VAFVVLDVECLRVRKVFKPVESFGVFVAQFGWNMQGFSSMHKFPSGLSRSHRSDFNCEFPAVDFCTCQLQMAGDIGDFSCRINSTSVMYRGTLDMQTSVILVGDVRSHSCFDLLGCH